MMSSDYHIGRLGTGLDRSCLVRDELSLALDRDWDQGPDRYFPVLVRSLSALVPVQTAVLDQS